jgi:hypothetical protein
MVNVTTFPGSVAAALLAAASSDVRDNGLMATRQENSRGKFGIGSPWDWTMSTLALDLRGRGFVFVDDDVVSLPK